MPEPRPESFFVTGGTLRRDAPSYVTRRADTQLREALLRSEFCYVLTARQMGKSSLMVQMAGTLREQGFGVAVLDLTRYGTNLTSVQWYAALVARIGEEMSCEEELEAIWRTTAECSPLMRFTSVLRHLVKFQADRRFVIFIDEIDVVRTLPFATDEFFVALRELFTARAYEPELHRLTFCLLGVASPADLIQDTRITPFNIGTRIELTDFTPQEAASLAQGLQTVLPSSDAALLLTRVLHWTGGQPYMTQRLCLAAVETLRRRGEEERRRRGERREQNTAPPTPQVWGENTVAETWGEKISAGEDSPQSWEEKIATGDGSSRTWEEPHGSPQTWGVRGADNAIQNPKSKIENSPPLPLSLSPPLLERVLYWTNGHPYLTQKLCQEVAADPTVTTPAEVDRVCADLFLSPRALESDFNLAYLRDFLLHRCADPVPLLDLYQRIVSGRRVRNNDTDPLLALLKLSGVVRVVHDRIEVRNRIYAALFDLRWIRAQMPGAELRRQRAAYWRGWARATAVCVPVFLTIGTLGTLMLQQKHRAETVEQEAIVQAEVTHRLTYAADMADVHDALDNHNGAYAREVLAKYRQDSLRDFDYNLLQSLCDQSQLVCEADSGRLFAAAFAPSGDRFATGGNKGIVKIWETATGKCLYTFPPVSGFIMKLSFSSNEILSVSLDDGKAVMLDTVQGKTLPPLTSMEPDALRCVALPDGSWKTFGGNPQDRLCHFVNWGQFPLPGKPSVRIKSITFHPELPRVALADSSGTVVVWDFATNKEIARRSGYGREAFAAFSPNGKWLAVSDDRGMVERWDANSLHPEGLLIRSGKPMAFLAFSPDARWLAGGSTDSSIQIWDIDTQQPIRTLEGHTGSICSLAFAPDGHRLLSSSQDGTARLWDTREWKNERPGLKGVARGVHRAVISPDGRQVATRDITGCIRLHDTQTGRVLWHYQTEQPDTPLQFTPNGRELASVDAQGLLHVWDTQTFQETDRIALPTPYISAFRFSDDAAIVALGVKGNTIQIWDRRKNQVRQVLSGQTQAVRTLAFSPDGRLLAAGSEDKTVCVWSWRTSSIPQVFTGHRAAVNTLAWTPNGRLLASGSADGTCKLWNLEIKRSVLTLSEQQKELVALQFNRSGDVLTTMDKRGRFCEWRAHSNTH